jgi:hypothetical protein
MLSFQEFVILPGSLLHLDFSRTTNLPYPHLLFFTKFADVSADI